MFESKTQGTPEDGIVIDNNGVPRKIARVVVKKSGIDNVEVLGPDREPIVTDMGTFIVEKLPSSIV